MGTYVKNTNVHYEKGVEATKKYEKDLQDPKFDHSKLNPTWQRMSGALDKAKQLVKEDKDFTNLLGSTIKSG